MPKLRLTMLFIHFTEEQSSALGLPFTGNLGRRTIMGTDSLDRHNHPDAERFAEGTDLRLVGTGTAGEWAIANNVKLNPDFPL